MAKRTKNIGETKSLELEIVPLKKTKVLVTGSVEEPLVVISQLKIEYIGSMARLYAILQAERI